jgi:hypothetical protein
VVVAPVAVPVALVLEQGKQQLLVVWVVVQDQLAAMVMRLPEVTGRLELAAEVVVVAVESCPGLGVLGEYL